MRIAVLMVVAAACSAPAARPNAPLPAATAQESPPPTAVVATRVVAPPPPAAAAASATAEPAPDPANLDFEVIEDDGIPKGWSSPGTARTKYIVAADHDAHHGATSLKLASHTDVTDNDVAFVFAGLDATPYRGKHVRLHAWIKTADVAKMALVSLSGGVSGGVGRSDGRLATGTTAWHEVTAETDIAPEAELVYLGARLIGGGTTWVDSLSLEVKDIEKPRAIVVAGRVVDHAHQPVAGAEVSLCDSRGVVKRVTTDANGVFSFDTMAGKWSVSAHHPPDVAAFLERADMQDDAKHLELVLGATDGTTVHVKVTAWQPAPAGSFATVTNVSAHSGDIWTVPIVDDAITAVVPRATAHIITLTDKLRGELRVAGGKSRVEGALTAALLVPPPEAVVGYLRDHATALAYTDAGHGFADMASIGKMVGNAHVVALGEATHGTREFFQLKHRFLEYLVAEKGFSVFAIEANQPECRKINAYIQKGEGDATSALAGIYFWTWNTEEVRAMVEWMRTWNADPKHTRKLEFTGFDMQYAKVAHEVIADYLHRMLPDVANSLVEPLALIAQGDDAFNKASLEAHKALAAAIAAVAKHLDDHRAELVKRSSVRELADVRHDVTILQQWQAELETSGMDSSNVRDEAMAANIQWLRTQHSPDTKFVVWAHNAHVARERSGMGTHLTKALGKDYVVFGFVFGEGSFQARIQKRQDELGEVTLGPAPEADISAPFTRTGKPLLVVDLRSLPPGQVARWFAALHPMRETGSLFVTEKVMSMPQEVTKFYDALIFVAKTTRARPIGKWAQ